MEQPGGSGDPLWDPLRGPMTAFYNFRFGVYDKVEPGKYLPSAPFRGKKAPSRSFWPLSEEGREQGDRRRTKRRKGLFIQVRLDKEFVGSLSGESEVCLPKDIIPMTGVAKDVFCTETSQGRLTYRGFPSSSEKNLPPQKLIARIFGGNKGLP